MLGRQLDCIGWRGFVDWLKTDLVNNLNVKDLWKPLQFLGFDLDWLPDQAMGVRKAWLIKKLLINTGVTSSNPVGSPGNPCI